MLPISNYGVDEALNYFCNKKTGLYDRVEKFIYVVAFDDLSKMSKYAAIELAKELLAQWKTNVRDPNEFTVTRAGCIYMEERVIPTLEGRLDTKYVSDWVIKELFK